MSWISFSKYVTFAKESEEHRLEGKGYLMIARPNLKRLIRVNYQSNNIRLQKVDASHAFVFFLLNVKRCFISILQSEICIF